MARGTRTEFLLNPLRLSLCRIRFQRRLEISRRCKKEIQKTFLVWVYKTPALSPYTEGHNHTGPRKGRIKHEAQSQHQRFQEAEGRRCLQMSAAYHSGTAA